MCLQFILFFSVCRSTMPLAPVPCPARACGYQGHPRAMGNHWRMAHEQQVLMYHCIFPGCSQKNPKVASLRWHWERDHGASKEQVKELRELPVIAELVPNRYYAPPGTCIPPLPAPSLPPCCASLKHKADIILQVKQVIAGARVKVTERRTVTLGAPFQLSTQTQVPSTSTASTIGSLDIMDVERTSPPKPVIAPHTPVGESGKYAPQVSPISEASPLPVDALRGQEPTYVPQASPISVSSASPSSPAGSAVGWEVTLPASPAFTAQSSPSIVLESPPVATPRPVLMVPPTPTRVQVPPQAIPPPAAVENVKDAVPVGHGEWLRRLQDIGQRRSALEAEHQAALREAALAEGGELQRVRSELAASQERCRLLEGRLAHLTTTGELSAVLVGDLEPLCTSRALLLVPHLGFTKVFHVSQEDLLSFDVVNRSPGMSCDKI